MKRIILIILGLLITLLFCSGITYSMFHSSNSLTYNQNIAKFIFNAERTNAIELSLNGLNPSENKEYTFAVSNTEEEVTSNVTIEYQIIIKTYHLIPLNIELYKVAGETENLVMTCDETYTRNSANELVCNSNIYSMAYSASALDNYKLKVSFDENATSDIYANLVDYINLEIKSWQKIERAE